MGFLQQTKQAEPKTYTLIPETFTHAVAIGQTGAGKTTSFIYPNMKQRIECGHGLLVYDYKGKEHGIVKYFADKAGRINDVIEIGKPWGSPVNLIRHMTNEDLSRFFEHLLAHSVENRYWGISATSLAINVLDLIGALEELRINFEANGIRFSKKPNYYETSEFNYPARKTLASLLECTQSHTRLTEFIEGLDDLNKNLSEHINDEMHSTYKQTTKQELKEIFDEILMSYVKVKKTVKRIKTALSIYTDSDTRASKTILSALITPLTQIAQNNFFNTDQLDIVDALNKGKIIVINSTGLSDTVLESLNMSIFEELCKRSTLRHVKPITVFMDEAQRLLGKNHTLPIDVLREAKVDVVLSFQDKSLVIDKIGQEKYRGLMANLSSQYFFRSNDTGETQAGDQRLDLLSTFECYTSIDDFTQKYISEPIFVDERAKHLSEYVYQKNHKLLQRFVPKHTGKKVILDFVPRLFLQGKFTAYDLNAGKEFFVDYEDPAQRRHSNYLFKSILETYETYDYDEDLEDGLARLLEEWADDMEAASF